MERTLKTLEVRLIGAPVSGGALRAEQGKLTIFVGGESALFESVKPVLKFTGNRLFHCGGVGPAQAIKLVNNIVAVANVLVTAEACRLALDNGLALLDFTQILEVSSGLNHFSAHEGEAAVSFASWTETHPHFDALISILRKDLGLAQEMTLGSWTTLPFIRHLCSIMDTREHESSRLLDGERCANVNAR